MPLTEDQQNSLNQLSLGIPAVTNALDDAQKNFADLAIVSKLATGGNKPDYDQFSDQDLRNLFDHSLLSSTMNILSDGTDPNDPGRVPVPHPYSTSGIVSSRLKSATMNREQLVNAVDALLEAYEYNIDPMQIAEAQAMSANHLAASFDGRFDRLDQRNMSLKEEAGEAYDEQPVKRRLAELKTKMQTFSKMTEKHIAGYVKAGLNSQLHSMAAKHASAEEFAAAIDSAKGRLNAVNFSGGNKHLAKNSPEPLDLSGIDLQGIDLSESDLSGIIIDAETFSRAQGLDDVKGVHPSIHAEAKQIKPLVERVDDLNQRLEKLENKSGVIANLRNLRHGGVDGERKHLIKEIEKATEALLQTKEQIRSEREAQILAQGQANEFEPQTTYQLGQGVTRRQGEIKDAQLEKLQASETFKLDAQVALNEQGASLAFAKTQIGSKSERMRAEGADPHEINLTRGRECGALDNVSALYGTEAVMKEVDFFDVEAKKAALGGDHSSLLTRSVATSVVDETLGMNSMAKERFGIDENGQHVGISVGVPGSSILVRGSTVEDKERFLNINYADSEVQKGLYDLQAQDYITGQIDRHTGNIFIDPHSGQVTGIDNDMAFPVVNREDMIQAGALDGKVVRGMPQFLHSDTADKIEALSPQALRTALQSIQPPDGVAHMEAAAIEGAVERLEALQREIKTMRKEGRIVDKFDAQTYDRAMERQQQAGMEYTSARTSYLAAAVMEKEKSIALGEKRIAIQKNDVPEQQPGEAKLAAYQAMVADARDDFAANPAQIQEPGLAQIILRGQEQLQQLQDQLQALNEQVEDAGKRLQEAKAGNDTERAEGLEEIFDRTQEARQETLQKIKTEQAKVSRALDLAVAPLKPALAAQARDFVLQAQVEQPQNQVAAANLNPRQNAEVEDLGEFEIKASKPNIERKQPDEISVEPSLAQLAADEESDLELNAPQEEVGMQEFSTDQPQVAGQDVVQDERHEAPSVAEIDASQDIQKFKLTSVRDALRNAAGNAKASVANTLERKGAEESLQDVKARHPGKVTDYKALQAQLKKLTDKPLKSIETAMNGDLAPLEKLTQNKENLPAQIEAVQQKMAALREEHPGLKQLDRSKVGQVVHSSLRDAAKTAGNRLKS